MRYHELVQALREREVTQDTNSLGKPIAQSPERLRNFWNWFGRSKVLDKQGRPLVVFHGTKKDFSAFDPARSNKQGGIPIDFHPSYFFTNATDVAQTYAGQTTKDWGFESDADDAEFRRLVLSDDPADAEKRSAFWRQHATRDVKKWDAGGNVMPVYLRMLKPLRAAGHGWSWSEISYDGELMATRDLIEIAIEKGRDGIIVTNVHDRREGKGKTSTIYAVFSPDQIKSAIGNAGGYSPNNANIVEAG